MPPRRVRIAMAAIVASLVVASVSVDRGHTLELVAEDGRPVPDALVAFHRAGSVGYAVAHPVTYQATPRAVVRSDALGRVDIPGRWVVHWPMPIQMHPSIVVELVYAPSLHNGLASIRGWRFLQPGVTRTGARRTRVQLKDLSNDPRQWVGSLGNLSSLTGAESGATPVGVPLVEQLTTEYAAFVARFAGVPRPEPAEPRWEPWNTDADRRRWREMIDADLARAPTWADLARRQIGAALEAYRGAGPN